MMTHPAYTLQPDVLPCVAWILQHPLTTVTTVNDGRALVGTDILRIIKRLQSGQQVISKMLAIAR